MEALCYTIIFLHKKFTDLFLNESDKSRYKISDQKCYFFMLLQKKTELLDYFVCFFVKMPLWNSVQRPWSSGHTFAPFLGRRARVSAHLESVWRVGNLLRFFVRYELMEKGRVKVGWPLDVAWQNSSLQIFTCFHHFFVPFCGFEPHSRRFFFSWNLILNGLFCTYSNTLEIHVINLWEICRRNQQNRDILHIF